MKNKFIKHIREFDFLNAKDRNILDKLFSDKFGIINAFLVRNELMKYGLSMVQSLSSRAEVVFNISKEPSSGGLGVDESPSNAVWACVSEAIERYCMSFVNHRDIKLTYLKNIPAKYKLDDFHLYSHLQYNKNAHLFKNPVKDKIYFTKIYKIDHQNEYIYWPASLVYTPFEKDSVAESTSTGLAAHRKLNQAIISGICEVIERDAVVINYLKKLNPPEILLSSGDLKKITLFQKVQKDFNIKIYKLYSDINIPIYLSYIWKKQARTFRFGIGCCAHPDSNIAISKVLRECLFTFTYSKFLMDLRPQNIESIVGLYEHFLYYQDLQTFPKLLFSGGRIEYKSEKHTKNELLQELERKRYHIYYKELTTKDIKKYTKIRVVKVIIPGFMDLNPTHNLPRLGASRLLTVPRLFGVTDKSIWEYPHPMP